MINLIWLSTLFSFYYIGIISDNFDYLLALSPLEDEAMMEDRDGIFQKDDAPGEEVNLLQGISHLNSDLSV